MTEPNDRRPVAIRISGNVKDLTISNNVAHGMPLLDATDGSITELTLSFNKVYSDRDAVTLGDVFGAEIAGNMFKVRVPREFAAEIKEAAKSPEKKQSLLGRLPTILPKPSEIEAVASLVDRVTKLF